MLAAAAAHAMVFALAPEWDAPNSLAQAGAGIVSMEPIAASRARSGPALGTTRRAGAAELEVDHAERNAGAVEGSEDAQEPIDPLPPSIVERLPAVSSSAMPRLSPLALAPRSHSRIATASPAGLWRDILNVQQVLDFLRTRYSRVLDATGARGYAVVEVWVDARGRVIHSEVHDSSGHRALEDIALELFDEVVRFEPRRGAGGRLLTSARFTIPFNGNW